ncbi:MAG: hypothetical protein ACLSVO_03010 [Alistipes sp.]|jgi:hypothetical protein|uniref:hypothetical protein n=1 Tax=Alistipes sp. TaxID=1872444 RepID=UPI00205E2C9F|nr:MAG TPA: hypothetical protein [Caudoviricetes sp.]
MTTALVMIAVMLISTLSLLLLFNNLVTQADLLIRVFGRMYGWAFAFTARVVLFILSPLLFLWLFVRLIASCLNHEKDQQTPKSEL